MPRSRLLFPLLNSKVNTSKRPPFFLSNGIYLDTIRDEDYGAIQRRGLNEYHDLVKIDTKCVYVDDPEEGDLGSLSQSTALRLRFLLNIFSRNETPILIPVGVFIRLGKKATLEQTFALEAFAYPPPILSQSYHLRPAGREVISAFHALIERALATHPGAEFSLQRFNSSLTRFNIHDKIVDTSICLESLISGNSELRFRLALYLAFITQSMPAAREDTFGLLKDLYDARSGIVHGELGRSAQRAITRVEARWQEVIRTTSGALSYYLAFLAERPAAEWGPHLERLVLGLETRVTD